MISDCDAELSGNDPRYEFVDAVDRVVGDACEDVAQIRLRIDAIEFCGANQTVNCGSTFTTRVCSSEQIVAATMPIST